MTRPAASGSLLLKVAAETGKHITLEGQEKDSTTAGLARMNMILHDFPTANIASGGEGTLVKPRFLDGEKLRTYDYVVANPPFSDKTWPTGLTLGEIGEGDRCVQATPCESTQVGVVFFAKQSAATVCCLLH